MSGHDWNVRSRNVRAYRRDAAAGPARSFDEARSYGVLPGQSSRQSLEPSIFARLEADTGTDLSGVRLHQDAAARRAAEDLGAVAFTRRDDIYFGAGAPSLGMAAGRVLLAHELTHVAQQRRADRLEVGAVGRAGDVHEQQAARAARGQSSHPTGGAVPEVQLQPLPGVARGEVQAELERFLRRAREAQGGRSLRITPEVRSVLERLVNLPVPGNAELAGDRNAAVRLSALDAWLAGGSLPGEPALFAGEAARRYLPDPCDSKALKILGGASPADQPGRMGRLGDLVAGSKAADPDPRVQAVEEQRGPSSTDRVEQFVGDQRRRAGAEEKRVGPMDLDPLRVGRILAGLPEAWRGPQTRQPATSELSPDVEAVIARIKPDALAEPGTAESGFDAQLVARGLARQIDRAHRNGDSNATLQLETTDTGVRPSEAVFHALDVIAREVRDALPHHAPGVRSVHVMFGGQVAWILPLGGTEK